MTGPARGPCHERQPSPRRTLNGWPGKGSATQRPGESQTERAEKSNYINKYIDNKNKIMITAILVDWNLA